MSQGNRTCIATALLWVVALPFQVAEPSGEPQLKPGLFERRVTLEKMLDRVQQNHPVASHRIEAATELKQEIDTIDRQYSLFISAVADSAYRGDAAQTLALCGRSGDDPVGLLVCRLANYIIDGRKNKGQFVEQFPRTGRALQALWMLDRIPSGNGGRPMLFEPDGPTDFYIGELYRIVATGDSRALSAYMRLYCAADGEYAEFMQGQMETLFRHHIEVVLRNWTEFDKCSAFLSNLQEELSMDEKHAILNDARRYCGTYGSACRDLIQLFSR